MRSPLFFILFSLAVPVALFAQTPAEDPHGQNWDYHDDQNPTTPPSPLEGLQKNMDEIYSKMEEAGYGNDVAAFLKDYPSYADKVFGTLFDGVADPDYSGNADIPWGQSQPGQPSWDFHDKQNPAQPPGLQDTQKILDTLYGAAEALGYGNNLAKFLKDYPTYIEKYVGPHFQDLVKMAEAQQQQKNNGGNDDLGEDHPHGDSGDENHHHSGDDASEGADEIGADDMEEIAEIMDDLEPIDRGLTDDIQKDATGNESGWHFDQDGNWVCHGGNC